MPTVNKQQENDKPHPKQHSSKVDVTIFMLLLVTLCVGYFFGFRDINNMFNVSHSSSGVYQQGHMADYLSHIFLQNWRLFAIPALPLILVFLLKISWLKNKPYTKLMVFGLVLLYVLLAGVMLGYLVIDSVGSYYAKPF